MRSMWRETPCLFTRPWNTGPFDPSVSCAAGWPPNKCQHLSRIARTQHKCRHADRSRFHLVRPEQRGPVVRRKRYAPALLGAGTRSAIRDSGCGHSVARKDLPRAKRAVQQCSDILPVVSVASAGGELPRKHGAVVAPMGIIRRKGKRQPPLPDLMSVAFR
ncbi:hypothetical protein MTO96_047513 [Rhipicephalus appendiculatus]